MSVLDQFGDDRRPILEVAMDQATPNRISKAWVRRRVGVVINQLNEQLTDEQIKSVIEALQRAKLI